MISSIVVIHIVAIRRLLYRKRREIQSLRRIGLQLLNVRVGSLRLRGLFLDLIAKRLLSPTLHLLRQVVVVAVVSVVRRDGRWNRMWCYFLFVKIHRMLLRNYLPHLLSKSSANLFHLLLSKIPLQLALFGIGGGHANFFLLINNYHPILLGLHELVCSLSMFLQDTFCFCLFLFVCSFLGLVPSRFVIGNLFMHVFLVFDRLE